MIVPAGKAPPYRYFRLAELRTCARRQVELLNRESPTPRNWGIVINSEVLGYLALAPVDPNACYARC